MKSSSLTGVGRLGMLTREVCLANLEIPILGAGKKWDNSEIMLCLWRGMQFISNLCAVILFTMENSLREAWLLHSLGHRASELHAIMY